MKGTEFRRILCPVNFADSSRRTVEGASILASMYDAELRLFHVVSDDAGDDRDAESFIASLLALTRRLPERARVSAALAYGNPATEITQHARLTGSDLIVLGTDLRSAPAEIGTTVVADIAANAPCPMLHVRPHLLPSLSGRGFAQILCCVDRLPGSTETADYALALAYRSHARVTLLNVLAAGDDTTESNDEAASKVDARRPVVHVSLTGSPGPEIVALARQIQSDLIVMGTAHKDTSAERKLGSTTAYVMVHAPCLVLVVPTVSETFQMNPNGTRIERMGDFKLT